MNRAAVDAVVPEGCVWLPAYGVYPLSSIAYVKGAGPGPYSIIYPKRGKPFLVSVLLKQLEDSKGTLLRIHKGYMVNPKLIKSKDFANKERTKVLLVVAGKEIELPVSRREIKNVKHRLGHESKP